MAGEMYQDLEMGAYKKAWLCIQGHTPLESSVFMPIFELEPLDSC